ncbi:MAG TPA: hypothetical protein VEH84_00840 [Alphaproteobacteria bacterium]|nr:hypothetical protein [Alphaproteobacteria bacterium]
MTLRPALGLASLLLPGLALPAAAEMRDPGLRAAPAEAGWTPGRVMAAVRPDRGGGPLLDRLAGDPGRAVGLRVLDRRGESLGVVAAVAAGDGRPQAYLLGTDALLRPIDFDRLVPGDSTGYLIADAEPETF